MPDTDPTQTPDAEHDDDDARETDPREPGSAGGDEGRYPGGQTDPGDDDSAGYPGGDTVPDD